MSILRIANMHMAGLNADVNPTELGEAFLTRAENIRMVNGGIVPFGGYEQVTAIAAPHIPLGIFAYRNANGAAFVIPCNDDILLMQGVTKSIKPADFVVGTDPLTWCFSDLGQVLIANNKTTGPYYYGDASTVLTALPWSAGKTWKGEGHFCKFMVAHKQFLFAFGLRDGNTETPDGLRWSAPADTGSVPSTWDPLDTTNVAGVTRLGGNPGAIVAALSLRDALAIYCENGIYIADYVGGRYVWKIRRLQSSTGTISRNSVVDVDGLHYFMTDGDIYVNDGNQVNSIATDKVRTLLNTISRTSYKMAFAVHNQKANEIWFCFPQSRDTESSVSLVLNYRYNSWSRRDLPAVLGCAVGNITSADSIWSAMTQKWDATKRNWQDDSNTPFDTVVVAVSKEGSNYNLVKLDAKGGFNSTNYRSIIERTDIALGSLVDATMITRAYVHATGASNISIEIGSQMAPGAPVTWKDKVLFKPSVDRKVDIRTTGMLHAYRIIASGVDLNFKITGIDFEYTQVGKR